MQRLEFDIIIPTFNMSQDLQELINSILSTRLYDRCESILVVDDGSVDNTVDVVEMLAKKHSKIKLITLKKNLGRFKARMHGAQSASAQNVLFIDSRVEITTEYVEALDKYWKPGLALSGFPHIDTSRSLFSLYWDRSHKLLFRRTYLDAKLGFVLNSNNFDDYVKGTGLLLVNRSVFLKSCDQIKNEPNFSDDTALMKIIVEHEPIFIKNELKFLWHPRETWLEFLKRIFDRGPGFVEYHFFNKISGLSYVCIFVLLLELAALFSLFGQREFFSWTLQALVGLGAFTALLLIKKWNEVPGILSLHLAVCISFNLSLYYGLYHYLKLKIVRPA